MCLIHFCGVCKLLCLCGAEPLSLSLQVSQLGQIQNPHFFSSQFHQLKSRFLVILEIIATYFVLYSFCAY